MRIGIKILAVSLENRHANSLGFLTQIFENKNLKTLHNSLKGQKDPSTRAYFETIRKVDKF